MNNLFNIIDKNPSKDNLLKHSIYCFVDFYSSFPKEDCEKIILYIGDCYSVNSPYWMDTADWGSFVYKRFKARGVPEHYFAGLVNLEEKIFVIAIQDYIDMQGDKVMSLIYAKENLKKSMMASVQSPLISIEDKGKANKILTDLHQELKDLYQEVRKTENGIGGKDGANKVRVEAAKLKRMTIAKHK